MKEGERKRERERAYAQVGGGARGEGQTDSLLSAGLDAGLDSSTLRS